MGGLNSQVHCNCLHLNDLLLSKLLLKKGHNSIITGEFLQAGHIGGTSLPQQLHYPSVSGKELVWIQRLSTQRPTVLETSQWALVSMLLTVYTHAPCGVCIHSARVTAFNVCVYAAFVVTPNASQLHPMTLPSQLAVLTLFNTEEGSTTCLVSCTV